MNKEKNKKMDDEMESVADLLPELSEEDKEIAVSQESISWVWGLLGRYRPGDIHNTGYGVLLQKVTFDTARCIRVYNHPEPLYMLNAFLSQFQHASAVLEIGSCTVLTPVPKVELEEPESNEESMSREKKVVEISTVNKEATKKSDYNFGMEVA